MFLSPPTNAQHTEGTRRVLLQLDSMRIASSCSRYFADIYYETTQHAIAYFAGADSLTQSLMARMEVRFADYFFRSANAFASGEPVAPEWEAYFNHKGASPLYYLLAGINAHINGDIWQALAGEFSEEELHQLRPAYFAYYRRLLDEYARVYASARKENKRFRWLHNLSFGSSACYGMWMLRRWRNRQMLIAGCYRTDPKRFRRLVDRVHRKMMRLNRLIRQNT